MSRRCRRKTKADDDDPLLDLPGFRIGKRGIEKDSTSDLRGKAGISRVEVNAYGRVIRELGHDPARRARMFISPSTSRCSNSSRSGWAIESAACVVMDVSNGDVIALASTPGYDPNVFNVGITPAQWQALTTDDHKPLINKAITGEYPPGSTFKPVMALAARGQRPCRSRVNCSGLDHARQHTSSIAGRKAATATSI